MIKLYKKGVSLLDCSCFTYKQLTIYHILSTFILFPDLPVSSNHILIRCQFFQAHWAPRVELIS